MRAQPDLPVAETALPRPASSRGWLERLWSSIAERGRNIAPIPSDRIDPGERARLLANSLLSERGEASGAAVARELFNVFKALTPDQRIEFLIFVSEGFQPDRKRLSEAARLYLAEPNTETAARLADDAEPPRQELLRRMNMAPGGTAALVAVRKQLLADLPAHPALARLDADLRHLFVSWFNRGFLELRRIDWQTPAAVLEKFITYEAVHEIQGWDDLRRRLAADRRCFAFFHPALPGEPLIFVEVALVKGLAGSIKALLERDTDEAMQIKRADEADTAIFYSISNCQDGLRGISFGNFLIKQVVEELRAELPGLRQFSTLSPVPQFRRWLEARLKKADLHDLPLSASECQDLFNAAGLPFEPDQPWAALSALVDDESWPQTAAANNALRPVLLRLCAIFLTARPAGKNRLDPVARFHLGNGARLERINWMGNPGRRGLQESYGIRVNYLYDPASIERNHAGFVRAGTIARAAVVDALLMPAAPANPLLLPRVTRRSRAKT